MRRYHITLGATTTAGSKVHLVIHKSDSKLMAPKIPVYIQ